MPHYIFEARVAKIVIGPIAGVDEAGRGPLAGPVVAAAVILDRKRIPKGLNDSKQMTADAREEAFGRIMAAAIVGVGEASVDEIDLVNIRQATHFGDGARDPRAERGAGLCLGRRQRCSGSTLPLRHPCRWRRPFGLDCRCFNHCQGDPRPHDAGSARGASRLWLVHQQGLRHRGTSRSFEPPWSVPASPQKFCTGLPDIVSCESYGLSFSPLIHFIY